MSRVTDFGAVGDGRTDDTAAIRHALQEGDGVLEFPRGRYVVSSPIVVDLSRTGWTAVTGWGGTASIVMRGAGPALRIVGSHRGTADPFTVDSQVWSHERQPVVADLEIVGAHPQADGVRLEGTMQCRLRGLAVRRARHAVHLVERNRNVVIEGCHLYHNFGAGIFLDGVNLHQINVLGCHISYNRLGGIRVERSEIRNLQICGNDIEYNNHRVHETNPEPTAEIYVDTTAEGASVNEIAVTGNTIQATSSPAGANIRILETPDASRPPGLWTITGNVIGSQENNIHLTGCYGVTITGNCIYSATHRNLLAERCRQLVIGDNVFRRHTDQFGTGIRLVDCQDVILSGGSVIDESPQGQASATPLLELIRCRRVTVQGCQFIGGVPFGIDALDIAETLISGCTIVDDRNPVRAAAAIRVRGKGTTNLIAHCRVGKGRQGDLMIDEAAGVALQANLLDAPD
ncbi:MAG: hypothetical protein D6725_08005 [Planctomycetota bacterium]|nr:MAG: hypothetical protein D6725_08005 [Planctomycetota bacterium]